MKFANGRGIGAAVVVSWALGGCGMLLGLDEYGPQTCDDRAKGAGEADVDCGGICGKACGVGMGCGAPGDCESQVCSALGRCEAATCADGLKNADESDKDCGGSCGATCGAGRACEGHGDCAGGVCEGGVCAATCSDGEKNADESDKDCGGPDCGDCDLGQACGEAGDCASGVCHAVGCVAEHAWSMSFGDAQEQTALDVATDKSGNVIVVGTMDGTVDFGGGPITSSPNGSYFVTKRDSTGKPLWSKVFGEPTGVPSAHATVDSTGNVIIGCTSKSSIDFGGGSLGSVDGFDMYVAKLDANGNHLWSDMFGSMGADRVNSIVASVSDTILISGEFSGPISFGGGILSNGDNFPDIFLVELKANGEYIWSKSYQGSASLAPFKMAQDSEGNIVIGGAFFGKSVNFGGSPLLNMGGNDIFLAKLDASGNHLWSKRFGSASSQSLLGMDVDQSGNIILAGNHFGSFDFGGATLPYVGGADAFVAKLNPSGDHLWSMAVGDSADQSAIGVATDSLGKVIVGGTMTGTLDFGGGPLTANEYDVFLVVLAPSGDHIWSRRYGGPNTQEVKAIATDDAGNVAITGQFLGSLDFGGSQLITAGLTDIFIAQLSYP